MKKTLAIVMMLFLGACSTHLTDLTIVSNRNVELDKVNLDKAPKVKNVIGEDKKFVFLFIPFGQPKLKEAVNDALRKGDGDLMLDVAVYAKSWWFIVGQSSIEVNGTVVNTLGAK